MHWPRIQEHLSIGLSISLKFLFHLFHNISPFFCATWQCDITCSFPSWRCYSLHMKYSSTSYRAVKILPILQDQLRVSFESSIYVLTFPWKFSLQVCRSHTAMNNCGLWLCLHGLSYSQWFKTKAKLEPCLLYLIYLFFFWQFASANWYCFLNFLKFSIKEFLSWLSCNKPD